jgi:hypothetical protein
MSDQRDWCTDAGLPPRARRPPVDPSPRTPLTSTSRNRADVTERLLKQYGHRYWGYVIYRTTYANDDDWDKFVQRLKFWIERAFERCNGRDILDLFKLTVFSDQAQFDGADTAAIRAHFKQWAETAWSEEQKLDKSGLDTWPPLQMTQNPRYHFCIQVDEVSLRSCLETAAPPSLQGFGEGWVKLISKNWIPMRNDPRAPARWPTYEPIEGVTEHDVGWMKVPYHQVMQEFYSGTPRENGWSYEYCRPPRVAGGPFDKLLRSEALVLEQTGWAHQLSYTLGAE